VLCYKQEGQLTEAEAKARAELGSNRADFMKRWFAIAISVGFATALSNMPWLKNGTIFDTNLPVDWDQVEQCARLTTAVIATILSWDGYFQSIANKPLTDGPRFAIDVFLVFLYLFLLLTSKFDYFWLWIHASAFLLYCLWDFLSIRKHRHAYVTGSASTDFTPSVLQVYRGCLADDQDIYRGPAITLIWPIYFWSLPLAHQFILRPTDREQPESAFAYAVLVIVGLFAYRHDKKKRLPMSQRLPLVVAGALAVIGVSVILRLVS
jgi:hypothetical protein